MYRSAMCRGVGNDLTYLKLNDCLHSNLHSWSILPVPQCRGTLDCLACPPPLLSRWKMLTQPLGICCHLHQFEEREKESCHHGPSHPWRWTSIQPNLVFWHLEVQGNFHTQISSLQCSPCLAFWNRYAYIIYTYQVTICHIRRWYPYQANHTNFYAYGTPYCIVLRMPYSSTC